MSALPSLLRLPMATATASGVPKNDRANDGAGMEAESAMTASVSAPPTQARATTERLTIDCARPLLDLRLTFAPQPDRQRKAQKRLNKDYADSRLSPRLPRPPWPQERSSVDRAGPRAEASSSERPSTRTARRRGDDEGDGRD